MKCMYISWIKLNGYHWENKVINQIFCNTAEIIRNIALFGKYRNVKKGVAASLQLAQYQFRVKQVLLFAIL